jgi:translation elongation factor EF-1beta
MNENKTELYKNGKYCSFFGCNIKHKISLYSTDVKLKQLNVTIRKNKIFKYKYKQKVLSDYIELYDIRFGVNAITLNQIIT